MSKKTIFSGIQPSGNLHIGNYLGAIQQWVNLQDEFQSVFCVVDLHAITVSQDPESLKKRILEITKIYLAAGIDPTKATLFQQSDISAHAELGWILNTITRMSDLFRMTQFKDKGGLQEDELNMDKINKVGVGIFDYPVLMAADILLYNTDVVPVGEDQKQHVELARDLARRFNHQFGDTFLVPEVRIKKEGAKIMGLDEPTKKMSKSAKGEYHSIGLMDSPFAAKKKIMRAVTDTESEVKFDFVNKPGISNLLNIYSLLSETSIQTIEKKYAGKGYGDFKKDLAEAVAEFLNDFQSKFNKITDAEARTILDEGAKKLRPTAEETLERVKRVVGLAR